MVGAPEQLIQARDVQLTAEQGQIGTEGDRIEVELTQGFRGVSNIYGIPTSAVNNGADIIHLVDHRFTDGQKVTYSASNTSIQGLKDGETYYVIVIGIDDIKLAQTEADALARIPVAIDLDTAGATGTHQLREELFVEADANGAVYLDLEAIQQNSEAVTVNLDGMTSLTDDMNLLIQASRNEGGTEQEGIYEFGGVTAAGAIIGETIVGGDFIIDSSTHNNHMVGYMDILNNSEVTGHGDTIEFTVGNQLNVQTGGNIYFTELTGGLDVRQAKAVTGDITLQAIETADDGIEHFLMHDNATIITEQGDVIILVGDDVTMTEGTAITAEQGTVTIRTEYNIYDPALNDPMMTLPTTDLDVGDPSIGEIEGVVVDLRGEITATAADITTNNSLDEVSLTNVTEGTTTTIRTFEGDDRIHVGSNSQPKANTGGTLNRVSGKLIVDAGEGFDWFSLDESADTVDNEGVLIRTRLMGLGMGNADQTVVDRNLGIEYHNFEDLSLVMGSAKDTLTIESTHDTRTRIMSEDGHDTLNVETIDGETTLKTGDGNDIITVADSSMMADGIRDRLIIKGGDNKDILNVYDTGDTTDNVGYLTDSNLFGLGMGGAIDYGTLELVNIKLGSGFDTFTVLDTHSDITQVDLGGGGDTAYVEAISGDTTVKGGTGIDIINVYNLNNKVDNIAALLSLKGDAGNDILNVIDSGDTTDNTGILTSSQIFGLGMEGRIDYGTFELLDLQLGSGHDQLDVISTHTDKTQIDMADGEDVVNVESVSGETTVKAGEGNDEVNIGTLDGYLDAIDAPLVVKGDRGNDSNRVSGLGLTHSIEHSSVENFDIQMGSGNDNFLIANAQEGQVILSTADGRDHVTVEATQAETTIKTGDDNDRIQIGNATTGLNEIEGNLILNGGRDRDTVIFDDAADASNDSGLLTGIALSGFGLAQAAIYNDIEYVNLNLGTGHNDMTIASTHAGNTQINANDGNDVFDVWAIAGETIIKGNEGNDTVHVGDPSQSFQDIQASLVVMGNQGNDSLQLNNASDTHDHRFLMTDSMLAGFDMPGHVQYGTMEQVDVRLGTGNDNLLIVNTHVGQTQIDTNSGNDQVTVEEVSGATALKTGRGNDVINVGNLNQSLEDITESLTISAGLDYDTLRLDNSGETENSSLLLTPTYISGLNLTQNLEYGAVEVLDIAMGTGGDTVTISDTHTGTTLLNTNDGNDVVYVDAIAGDTTVKTNNGNDSIYLGYHTQKLDGIRANLTIQAGRNQDYLDINNSASVNNTTTLLTSNTLSGLGMSGSVSYDQTESINMFLGEGNDTLIVQDTHAGTTSIRTAAGDDTVAVDAISGDTTIKTNDGEDTIQVGHPATGLNRVDTSLFLTGGRHIDYLVINDSSDTTSNIGFMTDTQIVGLGMTQGIDFGSFENVDVALGSGDDQMTILTTPSNTTDVHMGDGDDTVEVESALGDATVDGGVGQDWLRVGGFLNTLKKLGFELFG